MVKGHCPICFDAGRESLHQITDTGVRKHPTRGTERYWQLTMHSDGQGGLCPGGGKSI